MVHRFCVSVLIAVLAAPVVVTAQEKPLAQSAQSASPGPGPDIELRKKHERDVVLPKPSDQTVIQDMEQVTRDLGEPERPDRLIRQSRRAAITRPDLGHSVVGGIQ